MYVIVASKRDSAGLNIADKLVSDYKFIRSEETFEGDPIYVKGNIKLIYVDREITHVDHLDRYFSPNCYIFVSKHRSEKGLPSLTSHFPGNFSDECEHGGKGKELGFTYPSLQREYMRRLWLMRKDVPKYQIVIEAMHHGPTSLAKPVLFVEIGSSSTEWNDQNAASIVSRALMETLLESTKANKVGIGFGGVHYSEKFTRFILNSDFALGAIAPKYILNHVDRGIIHQMIYRCVEDVKYAVLDWKGLGSEKERILNLVEEVGLSVVKL
ncbi:MAG: D-aminoacyl-tRNA deacylase [Nitrososphaerota archaeon]|nr:D-aminoacyl-tRNA deacylase [Nitrososphaerota archaeon]